MSKEKITKTDIKNAVEKAFYDTLRKDGRRLTADEVAKAFEGSGIQYHFDSQTAAITIIVDGNSRIECIWRHGKFWGNDIYEIRPSMTYNSLTPSSDTERDLCYREFFFESFQLPAMIGFFRSFADRLIEVKKEFDNQTKNKIVGDVLKAMIKPLLRKEKIFKVKYLTGDDDGRLIMYKDFLKTVRLSVVLTADNYEKRIPEFGEVNRLMSELANRDDADVFFEHIYGIERGMDVEFVNPYVDQEPYSTMRYTEDVELIEFKQIEKTGESYSDLCSLLNELNYNWGWIYKKNSFDREDTYRPRPILQINNDLNIVIKRWETLNSTYYELLFARTSDINYDYTESIKIGNQPELFYFLRLLATQIPANELAELSFSHSVVNKVVSMIAVRILTFPHSIYHYLRMFQIVIRPKEKDRSFSLRIAERNILSVFDYLNENYESYLNLANAIAKFPEINLECIKL